MTLAEHVRASGKRLTLQRQLVLDAVQRAHHHVTADEIARRVRAKYPAIGPSTVYRNLEALEELGYVIHTHLDDRVTRWHRADSHPHGHLVCRSCGSETEVHAAALDAMARRLRADYRFEPDLAHSAIVGICRRCRDVPSQ
ncbi:MAG TPA: transcriptional repressor [Candidatus Limnocylindria bacterium]|jgi:Fur family ferric uptake transcriptional regulator